MILVTGASGNVGGTVVAELVKAGAKVGALTRDPTKLGRLPPQVTLIPGNFGDPPSLSQALQGVAQLFFVCLSEAGPVRLHKHDNLLQAAQQAGVEHVVYLSFLNPALDSPIPQARWHADTEQKLRESGMGWTILRASLYTQSLLSTAGFIEGGRWKAPAGVGRVAFVDREDLGRVAAACLLDRRHMQQVYEVTGAQALSWPDLAQIMSQLQGKPIEYEDIPPDLLADQLRRLGRPEELISGMLALFGEVRAGRMAACTSAVSQITGQPPRSVASILATQVPSSGRWTEDGGRWTEDGGRKTVDGSLSHGLPPTVFRPQRDHEP